MKQTFVFGCTLCLVLFFSACFSTKPVVTKQTFTYDYKTSSSAKPGSAGILVTLVKPHYASDFFRQYAQADVFYNFQKYIGDDIQELLLDKGYRIKSTYPDFANMTYDEKKDVDVALEIEIIPTFTAAEGGWRQYTRIGWTGPTTTEYGYSGSVSLIGKINLIGYEPLSHEKLWMKSIDIPSVVNIAINTSPHLQNRAVDIAFLNDPGVYNALGAALQQQYRNIFQQIDTYLDPREFADLKPQIKELKNKKVY